jgi:hypothetical protein
MVRHWSVKDESNASWSKCMYTYLRNVGPLSSWSSFFYMEFSFLHRVLIFSKVWVSDSKLRWLFSLLLTRVISCDIDPWERLDIVILLCPPPLYLKGCQFCPTFFLGRESWSQLYQMLLIALQLDHTPKYANQVWGWGYVKEGVVIYKELFSCRIFGISKLFHKKKSFWHRFKADSFWRNSSDSYREVFRCDENFLFCFFDEKYEVTFGWSQKVEISIWGVLRTVFRRKCENMKWHLVGHKRFKFQFEGHWEPSFDENVKTWSDIWWVTKGWNINLRVIENRLQSIHFICMNNDFVSHEKALPTDPDCLPLIIKGLIRHVM